MPHLGFGELVLIFMIVLVLFGAKKLPEAGAGLGKALRSFKDALTTPSDSKEIEEPPDDEK